MPQPLPTDNNTPPLSQCPVCDSYVYQCVVDDAEGPDHNPDYSYVLVEVTPVPPGDGPFVLSREKSASIDSSGMFPVVDRVVSGTCVPHEHQEFE